MDDKMYCFQCEQTAGGKGCTGAAGVCGKKADTAGLQDELTGAMIALSRAAKEGGRTDNADALILEGLFTCITNVNFNNDTLLRLIGRIHEEIASLTVSAGGCSGCCGSCGSCGSIAEEPADEDQFADYDMNKVWYANQDIRSLKSLILFGLRGMAAYAYHARVLGFQDESVNMFFYKALYAIGQDWGMDELLPIVMETGKTNLACMELLDKANTTTYGNPVPATVPLSVEKGPFIVVTGHDLLDLQQLLEQTEGKGVNVYTHGEMLPAHGYPELKKYKHLKGNFGTAWQNQQKEFGGKSDLGAGSEPIPAPVLFTTNCLMVPKENYIDRVFTTEVVSFPNVPHISADANGKKDFSAIIDKAIELGGYKEDTHMTGINGGDHVTTGFGHNTVLGVADKVVEAVNNGDLKHIFLVGGCDGARPGRNYFTDFVKATPKDTMILTLACGKYRFNDLELGTVNGKEGGLPRLLDMGQCNDAYSAITVAVALAKVFKCSVNELPLSMVLSWYEQKAVCILLTLLDLGIQNIKLGPTLPAFISPNVLDHLVKTYNIAPTTTAEEDLAEILGK